MSEQRGQDSDSDIQYRLSDAREAERASREYVAWVRADEAARYKQELERQRKQVAALTRKLELERQSVTPAKLHRFARRVGRGLARRLGDPVPSARRGPQLVGPDPSKAPRRPRFSIIVPVFNNGACLLDSVESVRLQTLPDFEIILWDDGTSDPSTLEILYRLKGPGIHKFSSENQGVVGARNSAVAKSTGEFLVFLDPDDALEPTYLEKALITFCRYPEIDLVVPATRVIEVGAPDIIWYPAFDEKMLSYHNTAPVATAFRRRVWDAVGGFSEHLSAGFEDWAFWRAAASYGFRGKVLKEPLFRYTYSASAGRDAAARTRGDDLERRIKMMYPTFAKQQAPRREREASVREMLETQVFHKPASDKRGLVLFVPWMLRGGGAENFLLSAIPSLREDFEVVVVATQSPPRGAATCEDDFAEATPYVYDISRLVGVGDRTELVKSIVHRFWDPTLVIIGSAWAYEHIRGLKEWSRGRARVVDVHFNHVGHLTKLLAAQADIDLVLTAHHHLQALLENFYDIKPPTRTVYVAPPQRQQSRRDRGQNADRTRLSVGWLGRNSSEKRPDLVLQLAALAPEFDFRLAGSGIEQLRDQAASLSNVEIVGWIEDAETFLSESDFVLNTSDTEGVSLTAMESLELGIPVLTRDVGGMSELITDCGNGLIYDAEDLGGLVRRLRDTELIEQIRKTASNDGLPKRFSPEQMIATLSESFAHPTV